MCTKNKPFKGEKLAFVFHTPDDCKVMDLPLFNDFLKEFDVSVCQFNNDFNKLNTRICS